MIFLGHQSLKRSLAVRQCLGYSQALSFFPYFQGRKIAAAPCRVSWVQTVRQGVGRFVPSPLMSSDVNERTWQLPKPDAKALEQAVHKDYMKYRKPEFCKGEGCAKKIKVFKDLTRHLISVHSFTRDKYNRFFPKCSFLQIFYPFSRDAFTHRGQQGQIAKKKGKAIVKRYKNV